MCWVYSWYHRHLETQLRLELESYVFLFKINKNLSFRFREYFLTCWKLLGKEGFGSHSIFNSYYLVSQLEDIEEMIELFLDAKTSANNLAKEGEFAGGQMS